MFGIFVCPSVTLKHFGEWNKLHDFSADTTMNLIIWLEVNERIIVNSCWGKKNATALSGGQFAETSMA